MNAEAKYPHSIDLIVRHTESVAPNTMARAYVEALHAAGLGEVVEIWMANSKPEPGDRDALFKALDRVGSDAHFLAFRVQDGTEVLCDRDRGTRVSNPDGMWHVEVSREGAPTEEWMAAMEKIARAAIAVPDFLYAFLERDGGRVMSFVPRPPLARSFHLVTTSETQVSERYHDPAAFWRVWERVENIGDLRLCIRHMDALEEQDWLARTFDDTMELARHANPKLTWYSHDPYWYAGYAPWWEPGDPQDEKAGYPALTFVGYNVETRTLEYTGFVARGRLHESDGKPRHVLITEIHEIHRALAREKTREGQPVNAVHVVFPEEWMARQERRPLLDVGARVFYADGVTGGVVEVAG